MTDITTAATTDSAAPIAARPKVLVTGIVPRAGLDDLFNRFEVTYAGDQAEPYSREWVLARGQAGYEGLLLMGQKADRELIDAFPQLKVISLNAVGYDHVDIAYAKSRGIVVSNSPQAVRVPTAELTFALILAAAKRLYLYDSIVRAGQWVDVSKRQLQGTTLEGQILGIFGMGRIGSSVAKYAQAFGMSVIYHDACRLDDSLEQGLGAEFVSFDELLSRSDVLTIHAPALPSTTGLFDERAFAAMKGTAYLVNAARGTIVKEQALVEALQTGQIAGAGLDVFEFEPTVSEQLRALPNVIMSPHAGTGTIQARKALAHEAAQNIINFFDGTPSNVVNG